MEGGTPGAISVTPPTPMPPKTKAAPGSPNFCKNCGERLEEGAKYCRACGASVVLMQTPSAEPAAPAAEPPPAPPTPPPSPVSAGPPQPSRTPAPSATRQRKSIRGLLLLVGAIIAIGAIAIIGVIALNGGYGDSPGAVPFPPTSTSTPTPHATATPTVTDTLTPTPTPTSIPTSTPTPTPMPTVTHTPTPTPTPAIPMMALHDHYVSCRWRNGYHRPAIWAGWHIPGRPGSHRHCQPEPWLRVCAVVESIWCDGQPYQAGDEWQHHSRSVLRSDTAHPYGHPCAYRNRDPCSYPRRHTSACSFWACRPNQWE